MKKLFFIFLITIPIFLVSPIFEKVNASSDPIPQVAAKVFYPDVCNPEFWVTFVISNLGATSSSDSYLSVSLSHHLEFINWETKPNILDMVIRSYEIGETRLNISGLPLEISNKIIEVYNHSFKNNETIEVTLYLENTAYQSPEWIKSRLVMYPANTSFPASSIAQDPPESIRKDQQGYSVYQFAVEPNKEIYPIDLENVEIIPEFPSWIILPLFLTFTLSVVVLKKRLLHQRS